MCQRPWVAPRAGSTLYHGHHGVFDSVSAALSDYLLREYDLSRRDRSGKCASRYQAALNAGGDVFVVYSTEREDSGNQSFKTRTIPKVVSGVTPACLEVGEVLYGQVIA